VSEHIFGEGQDIFKKNLGGVGPTHSVMTRRVLRRKGGGGERDLTKRKGGKTARQFKTGERIKGKVFCGQKDRVKMGKGR